MRNDIFTLAKQADLDTKQAVPEFQPPVQSVDVQHNRETVTYEETTGTRFPAADEYGTEFWTLTAKGAARMASLPRLLSAFLGSPVSTATADATAKKHDFDPVGKSLVPHSAFVVRKDPNPAIVDLFYGILGNKLTLSVNPNGFLEYEAELIAKYLDPAQAAPAAALDASPRIKFDQAVVYISVNGGAEAAVKCGAWQVAYDNAIDTDEAVLGSTQLYTIAEENAGCDVSFSPREQLSTYYRRALQATPDEIQLRLAVTGSIIGTGIAYAMEWKVLSCRELDAPANISAADRLKMVQVSAKAHLDSTSGKFVTASVTNKQASY
jgi:hypothetical protein